MSQKAEKSYSETDRAKVAETLAFMELVNNSPLQQLTSDFNDELLHIHEYIKLLDNERLTLIHSSTTFIAREIEIILDRLFSKIQKALIMATALEKRLKCPGELVPNINRLKQYTINYIDSYKHIVQHKIINTYDRQIKDIRQYVAVVKENTEMANQAAEKLLDQDEKLEQGQEAALLMEENTNKAKKIISRIKRKEIKAEKIAKIVFYVGVSCCGLGLIILIATICSKKYS